MKSKEWLILNAVECWLHYYSKPDTPTVQQYKELREEFNDAYQKLKDAPKPEPKTTRKRSSAKSTDDPSPTAETV